MSGIVHNIITRRPFTFSSVAGSGQLDVPLIRALDVSDAKAIDVVVRIHAANFGTGSTIAVIAQAVSLTSEEPNVDFIFSAAVGTLTITKAIADTAPTLHLGSLTPPWGHMIRIYLKGTQPASPVTLTATLSIDLVVRDN